MSACNCKACRTLHDIATKHGTDQATEHDYMRRLEPFLALMREQPITLLEIGVAEGKSLRTWREYFPNANIIGVDNNADCWNPGDIPNLRVINGDAGSGAFWRDGGVPPLDIVIDDGSHRYLDIINAFSIVWLGKLRHGGLYIIEDVHANWLPDYKQFGEWLSYFTQMIAPLNRNGSADGKQDAAVNEMDFMHFTKGLIIIKKL